MTSGLNRTGFDAATPGGVFVLPFDSTWQRGTKYKDYMAMLNTGREFGKYPISEGNPTRATYRLQQRNKELQKAGWCPQGDFLQIYHPESHETLGHDDSARRGGSGVTVRAGGRIDRYNYLETRASGSAVQRPVGGVRMSSQERTAPELYG